jgi:hypothetical protein
MDEQLIKLLGQRVELLSYLIQDLYRQIADIYKELDMVDESQELTGYDLCECPPYYGHLCQDKHRI